MIEKIRAVGKDVGRKTIALSLGGLVAGSVAVGTVLDDDVKGFLDQPVDTDKTPAQQNFVTGDGSGSAADQEGNAEDTENETVSRMISQMEKNVSDGDVEYDVMGC